MTFEDIMVALEKLNPNHEIFHTIVFTGGEPLLQVDDELLEKISDYFTGDDDDEKYIQIHLETNGTAEPMLKKYWFDHVTVSPKGSIKDIKIPLEKVDDVKILFPLLPCVDPGAYRADVHRLYIQPIMGEDYQENLDGAIRFVYQNPEFKLSIQLHKVLGVK
jgi:organic radical activating enzyme